MEKLTNLIKNTEPKKLIVLTVAAVVGAAYGVKAVVKKRKRDLDNSKAKQKATEVLNITLAAGAKVVGGIREDISTVVASAKDKSCAVRCAHCVVAETFKPCCKDCNCPPGMVITGAPGSGKSYGEVSKLENILEEGKFVGVEMTFATQNVDELERLIELEAATLQEPVEAEASVASSLAEKLKNDVLQAQERATVAEAKKRKPRAPRAAKAKPVTFKDAIDSALGVGKIELGSISDAETVYLEKPEEK